MAGDEHAPGAAQLVSAIRDAAVAAHRENAAHSANIADERLTNWLEAFEAEHKQFFGPLLALASSAEGLPDPVRSMLSQLVEPTHQTEALLGVAAAYAVVSGIVSAALQPFIVGVSQASFSALPDLPLSPADMALAVVRGIVSEGDGAKEARNTGVNADRFGVLVANTGEPPGLMQLLEAYRRGFIDQGQLEHGIRQSRVRDEWIPTVLKLQYAPPPIGEAIAAAVQNHLSQADARRFVSEAGVDPVNFDWLYETHGRPPGVFEVGELVNRGEESLDFLKQAIRESDIKDKYVDAVAKLIRKIPPERTVVSAIRQGVLSPADGVRKLMDLGFNASDAAMLASEAQSTKHAATKDLARAQITQLYEERLIPKDQATKLLHGLGYDATEVGMLLSLADHSRHYKFQASAISRVHSLYIAHRLARHDASTSLDKIGVDPGGRDDLLTLWDAERAANVPHLSVAQLQHAVRQGIITHGDFATRVEAMGYSHTDMLILYHGAWPPTTKGEAF